MLFNSIEFIFLFLPLTLIVYFTLNKLKKDNYAKFWLVLASLYFYGYFNKSYLILIISSIFINYGIANLLLKNKINKKILLILGCTFNVGILVWFKYMDFFIGNINIVFNSNIQLLKLILPLGISFFTFQQLSFIIDNYNGKEKKHDFLSYCLFVTFFPQLIAGPIVLPGEMLPQFENSNNKFLNYKNMNKGIYIFSIGLVKKIFIADSIATFANVGFDKMIDLTIIEAWLTSISYTFQLYFDFSGYCDMAMGIALMFNIILPLNFNSPYKSANIQEFWKRWHMTLGRFLTNYLYIPCGGNRKSNKRTLLNLLVVFIVSGLWHGAGWTFIIWGILHGIAILIHRIWNSKGYKMNKFLGLFVTFNLVNVLWIFFRATSISKAIKIIKSMFNLQSLNKMITIEYKTMSHSVLPIKIILLILIIGIILSFFTVNAYEKKDKFKANIFNNIENVIYIGVSLLFINRIATFLYFNF